MAAVTSTLLPDAVRARVVALYDDGLSFSMISDRIAAEFGRAMSRSAVAGCVARFNQKRGAARPKRAYPVSPSVRAAWAPAGTAARAGNEAKPKRTSVDPIAGPPVAVPRQPGHQGVAPLADPVLRSADPKRKSTVSAPTIPPAPGIRLRRPGVKRVTELEARDCRYPSDEIDAKGQPFIGFRCCAQTAPGRPWCDAHERVVYTEAARSPKDTKPASPARLRAA